MDRTSSEQGMLRTNGTMRIQNAVRFGGTWTTDVSVTSMVMFDEVAMLTEAWCSDAMCARRIAQVIRDDERRLSFFQIEFRQGFCQKHHNTLSLSNDFFIHAIKSVIADAIPTSSSSVFVSRHCNCTTAFDEFQICGEARH